MRSVAMRARRAQQAHSRVVRHGWLILMVMAITAASASAAAPAGAATWSWSVKSQADPGNNIDGMSCPTSGLCVGVDRSGNTVTSTAPASGSWTVSTGVDASGNRFSGVSCPTTTLCVAADWSSVNTSGNILSTDPFSQASSSWTWSTSQIDSHGLSGVGCATNQLCLATTNQIPTQMYAMTTDPTGGPGAWTTLQFSSTGPTGTTSSPSCATGTAGVLCAAVDSSGYLLWSTDPGNNATDAFNNLTAWKTAQITSTSSLVSLTCPVYDTENELCVAADFAGNFWYSTNPTGGASAWHSTSGALAHGLACAPGTHVCIAGDNNGNVWTTSDAAGGTWTEAPAVAAGAVESASCPSATFCVLGTSNGDIITGALPAPPSATAPPTVSGAYTVGTQLSTTSGQWSGCSNAACTYSYQWWSCPRSGGCSQLGSTDRSYTLTAADEDARVYSCVIATNSVGSSPPDCGNPGGPVSPLLSSEARYMDSGFNMRSFGSGSSPSFDAGSSVPMEWGCSVNGGTGGSGVAKCQLLVFDEWGRMYQVDPAIADNALGVDTATGQLPTVCAGSTTCTYTLMVQEQDGAGHSAAARASSGAVSGLWPR